MSKPLLDRFLTSYTEEVLARFASLPGAIRGAKYVYVPGTRDDRVLLVAHADTVGTRPPVSVDWKGNIATVGATYIPPKSTNVTPISRESSYYSIAPKTVLGADDRAGCAIMWTFRNSGHSLLICDEEELGCVGAEEAAIELVDFKSPDCLSRHLFAIEVDRRGDTNYVFYDVSTPEFETWIASTLPAWSKEYGSFSDIACICEHAEICGVNLAAGYLYEHTRQEVLMFDAWRRSRAAVERILQRATQRFPLDVSNRYTRWGRKLGVGVYSSGWSQSDDEYYERMREQRALGCAHPSLRPSQVCKGLEWCQACGAYIITSEALDCFHEWVDFGGNQKVCCHICGLAFDDFKKYDPRATDDTDDIDPFRDTPRLIATPITPVALLPTSSTSDT